MKLRSILPWLAGVVAFALVGCGPKKPQLNLFIWSEYIDAKLIAEFERQFHCHVNVDLYEDPDSMIAKLAAGGASLYDIVVPSDNTLPTLIHRGLVAPMPQDHLPNFKNLDPRFLDHSSDPGNRFSVPAQWGTVGLFLRKAAGKSIDESWSLVFDPTKQLGSFLLIEDVRACIGAALRYRGFSANTTNLLELAQARDLLIETKKRSLGFEGGTGAKNRVLSKGAAVGMAYNSDAMRGVKEDPETVYFVPREGSEIWLDLFSIPSQAPHRELAEKFINYMLDAKVGAAFAHGNQAGSPNKAAMEFLDPQERNNPAIYPSSDVMSRLEYSRDLGAANRLYDEVWVQVKGR